MCGMALSQCVGWRRHASYTVLREHAQVADTATPESTHKCLLGNVLYVARFSGAAAICIPKAQLDMHSAHTSPLYIHDVQHCFIHIGMRLN